ncbi:MAG TPA: antibiotic biosynthesis monooxygenase family protein [Euzebyales bacterium]|nr:antibiotic biosynthesis monooxygenase family protein [Euzebyales bacterium]
MTLEIAIIDVTEGEEDAFVASFGRGRETIVASEGCRSVRMTRGVESPSRFVLLVEWDSVVAHEAFRASDGFGQWRGHVAPHFAAPPVVEHFEDVGAGGGD